VTRNGVFSVLGPGLDSLRGQHPHCFLRWDPLCVLRQWFPRLLLRVFLEEPKPPQALATAQKAAGARGAGQPRLPEEANTG
jgi:hypothetical protein